MIKLDSSEYIYIPERSDYYHRYFRNCKTNEIILEKVGYASGNNLYYNIGTDPTFSGKDISPEAFLGFSNKSELIETNKIVTVKTIVDE